jgi:hypothetical protein
VLYVFLKDRPKGLKHGSSGGVLVRQAQTPVLKKEKKKKAAQGIIPNERN